LEALGFASSQLFGCQNGSTVWRGATHARTDEKFTPPFMNRLDLQSSTNQRTCSRHQPPLFPSELGYGCFMMGCRHEQKRLDCY